MQNFVLVSIALVMVCIFSSEQNMKDDNCGYKKICPLFMRFIKPAYRSASSAPDKREQNWLDAEYGWGGGRFGKRKERF